MKPITLQDLLVETQGHTNVAGAEDLRIERIVTDSRRVERGDLFWALRGNRYDGNAFAGEALKRGAVACVVDGTASQTDGGVLVQVQDTLEALWALTRWYRARQPARVIGITGSFGKTTTRAMIHTVLSGRFATVQSPRNFNNQIGVPLSILQIEPSHEFAVLELAASRVGEIRELAELVRPDVAVITGIGPAHLETFQSVEQVLATKAELIENLPQSGRVILCGDDGYTQNLIAKTTSGVTLVGEGSGNDVTASHVDAHNELLHFRVDGQPYRIPVAGRHFVRSALMAIAVGRLYGLTDSSIADGLSQFHPVAGRCVPIRIGAWTVLDDTYNANPVSCQAACQTLADWQAEGHKWLVVGDMLALGPRARTLHYQLGQIAAQVSPDYLLACGAFAEDVTEGARSAGFQSDRTASFESWEQLVAILEQRLRAGDVLLVKGSRDTRMERVIERLQQQAVKLRNREATLQRAERVCA